MSKSNTWLVVPDANYDDLLPEIIRERTKIPIYEDGELSGYNELTWREFTEQPENKILFGDVIDFTCKYDDEDYHIVEFEAFTTTGEREEINQLRGERPQTDPSWAIVSATELKNMIAAYRK